MSAPPAQPKIYHITHVHNLPSILADNCLVSDAIMLARGGPSISIGVSDIKRRRVEELNVECYPGTTVGQYVPFFFCPRSVMLYVIFRGNHPELPYRGGQEPIVHLEADLREVVAWARTAKRRWAFCPSNAGAYHSQSQFLTNLRDLDKIDWEAVAATDFRDRRVKEAKQAEFLIQESLPWSLIQRLGVKSAAMQTQVEAAIRSAVHHPPVEVHGGWYY